MKSYEETISTVFDRVEQYHIQQKRKKKIVLSTVTPFCLIAVCISGFLILKGVLPEQSPDTTEVPSTPVSMDLPTSSVDVDPVVLPTENDDKIIINPVKEFSEQRMNIALHMQDEIFMTIEELCEYYGTDITPEVPNDLTQWTTDRYSIFKRNQKMGEIYWDQNIQHFSNEDYTREIMVETAKGKLPFHCCVIHDPVTEGSIINGVEVAIGLSENGYYGVWFMYQNTGFYIFAEGITEDELISVIKSLTK